LSQIRILPENLANQIAAGEVVERPASVVKELVENAIDAGAGSVAVQVEGGGTSLIRVIDDGEGMDQDDILLSLERHATSKLNKVEQLDDIRTLGFRGEAVPSIASVSRMTITSRQVDSQLGSRVEIRFGKVMKVHEMGGQTGTVVEIRDLFGNVPARKKFLKTPRTELSHIEETVRNYALAKPELSVSYAVNGREIFSLPGVDGPDALAQRFKSILRSDIREELVAVSSVAGEVGISGLLLPPGHHYGKVSKLRAFVNGRPVRDRLITHAVAEGLRNYLMKGRQPAGVLFIVLPPAAVDVNVHPAKQEIRFHRSGVVHQLIVKAVAGAMTGFQSGLKSYVFGEKPSSPSSPESPARPEPFYGREERPRPIERPSPSPINKKSGDFRGQVCDRIEDKQTDRKVSEPVTTYKEVDDGTAGSPGSLRVIGQFLDTYIFCEGENGLVVVDQHAAQERLIFEKLKKEFASGNVSSQSLLFPETVELGSEEISILEDSAEEISRLGLDIREFGGNSYVIKAIPAVMSHLPVVEVFNGLIDQFSGVGGRDRDSSGRRLDSVLSVIACKAAIKANQALSHAEMKGLLNEMYENDVFSHCPHGRPVIRRFSVAEIKKWFHRT
jgi:DNA mismatch repair protein MutL